MQIILTDATDRLRRINHQAQMAAPAGAWVDRVRCLPVLITADLGRAVLFGSTMQALTGPGWRLSWYVLGMLLAAISIIVSYILAISTRQRLCPPELQGRVRLAPLLPAPHPPHHPGTSLPDGAGVSAVRAVSRR